MSLQYQYGSHFSLYPLPLLCPFLVVLKLKVGAEHTQSHNHRSSTSVRLGRSHWFSRPQKLLRRLSLRDERAEDSQPDAPESSSSAPPPDAPSARLPALSSPAAAQMLPEPEPPRFRRRRAEARRASAGDADCPLPSPEEILGAAARISTGSRLDGRDKDPVPCSPRAEQFGFRSKFGRAGLRKASENVDTRTPRTEHRETNCSACSQENFRPNGSVRSASASPPISSPLSIGGAHNIHRTVSDLYPHVNTLPFKGARAWSDPEMPNTSMAPGRLPPTCHDVTAYSSDNSPIQSPSMRSPNYMSPAISPLQSPPTRSPSSIAWSPSGSTSPIHPRMSYESSNISRSPSGSRSPIHPRMSYESHNVHRLPLPPAAAIPSSNSSPQLVAKQEQFRMQSRWQKGKLIGRGTFGSVYVATNRKTGALCAMKEVELLPNDPKSAECMKQLEQEIKVLSQLKHPNIVQYYGSEIVDDYFYIYLEFVHPGSINKYIREHCGAITESVVRNFTRHILSGLAYLHSTMTIHRDIKGANLLVDSSGVVKLADFGMAKHLTGQRADLSLKGSPYWMAPELMQAVMQRDSTPDLALAVDIWSLGCTIIEMFTGKPPWSDYEGAAAMFKVMRETPPIPDSLSPEGKDFLKHCFRRNPAERPSATALLDHPFLRNSQQLHVASCTLTFSAANLMDKPSPREVARNKLEHLPIYQYKQSAPRSSTSDHEYRQQSQPRHEHSDISAAHSTRNSPRSTLEKHISLSPVRSEPIFIHRRPVYSNVHSSSNHGNYSRNYRR